MRAALGCGERVGPGEGTTRLACGQLPPRE
jgi:hypothetical protein